MSREIHGIVISPTLGNSQGFYKNVESIPYLSLMGSKMNIWNKSTQQISFLFKEKVVLLSSHSFSRHYHGGARTIRGASTPSSARKFPPAWAKLELGRSQEMKMRFCTRLVLNNTRADWRAMIAVWCWTGNGHYRKITLFHVCLSWIQTFHSADDIWLTRN